MSASLLPVASREIFTEAVFGLSPYLLPTILEIIETLLLLPITSYLDWCSSFWQFHLSPLLLFSAQQSEWVFNFFKFFIFTGGHSLIV